MLSSDSGLSEAGGNSEKTLIAESGCPPHQQLFKSEAAKAFERKLQSTVCAAELLRGTEQSPP